MKKQSKSNHQQNPPIKGYQPIRIPLPPVGKHEHSFTSFIYIKEHIQKTQSNNASGGNNGGSATLFVANAPSNGPIRADLFLRALFESYGDIQRVTVARKVGAITTGDGDDAVELFREAALQGMDYNSFASDSSTVKGDGKFAHVVFTSGKELKKATKALKKEMSGAGEDLFVIRLDNDRMEQLKMETAQLMMSTRSNNDSDSEDDEEEVTDATTSNLTGIQAVAEQARQKAGRHISRQKLLEMCNAAMAAFEDEEAESERRAKLAAEQPDEDGFITVTHGSSAPSFGTTNDLEEEQYHRRKGGKRNRKRKAASGVVSGADELQDFYRFQLKETRKKEVGDLKKRFEEDLAKVKKMKEERAYRPF